MLKCRPKIGVVTVKLNSLMVLYKCMDPCETFKGYHKINFLYIKKEKEKKETQTHEDVFDLKPIKQDCGG